MPFPLVALFAVVKVACVVCGAVFCTHKVTEAYKKNQKLKGLKYKDREAARQTALEANKQLNSKETEQNQKLTELENRIENRDKKIEEVRRKSQDPNLSDDEKRK